MIQLCLLSGGSDLHQRFEGARQTAVVEFVKPLPVRLAHTLKHGRCASGHRYVAKPPIDKHGTLRDPAVFSRAARRAAERAGIGAAGPHALRHTAATQMLVLGVHPKVVADRLGHSTTRMTMDVYSHVVPALESDAANKVDGALRDILGQQMSAISQSVEDDAAKSKNRKCLRRKGFRWWAREVSNL